MSLALYHIEHLKALLGPRGWKEGAADLAPFLYEWRDRWVGETPAFFLQKNALLFLHKKGMNPHLIDNY